MSSAPFLPVSGRLAPPPPKSINGAGPPSGPDVDVALDVVALDVEILSDLRKGRRAAEGIGDCVRT